MTVEPGEGAPMSGPQPPAGPHSPQSPPAGEIGGPSSADALQSMLSRAVEGQAGEQRELTNAVTDMRNQLMRLSQELAELRVRPATDEASDAHNNTVTVEMREAVRFLSERLDGVTRMVAQRGEELADIRTALTAIDAHVRSQAETIVVLSNGLQALPSYGERVSVLQDNLQVLHRQLIGIEEAVGRSGDDSQLGERLTAIESAMAPLGERLNDLSDRGSAQSELLSQLQSSSSQLQQRVSGVHESVTGIRESVAEPIGDLDARIKDSVGSATRETEQRLMAHVDDAVMALAHTLLRRRPPTTAGHLTGTPIGEAPTAEPAVPVATPPLVTSMAAAAPSVSSAADIDDEEDVEAAAERAEALDAVTESTQGADELADVTVDEELPPVHQWGAGAPTPEASSPTDGTAIGVLDEADGEDDAVEPEDDAKPQDGLDADEPERDAPADDLVKADNEGPPASYTELPPPVPGTAVGGPSAPPAWTPQTPPVRNPADPTVNFEEGKKKRRWGRKK